MKKIYIAGCGGMLGEAFNDVFSKSYDLKCSDIDINENWLTFLNFNDSKSYNIDVKNFSPDALIHLGALTDLEYCEKNIDLTYDTNTTSVKTAVKISNDLSIPLIFISTAGIFGGDKDYYNDSEISCYWRGRKRLQIEYDGTVWQCCHLSGIYGSGTGFKGNKWDKEKQNE